MQVLHEHWIDMANPAISILIPVLNKADGLPDLLRRLTQVLDDLDESWEVLFVDDGSRDTTWRQLRDHHVWRQTGWQRYDRDLQAASGFQSKHGGLANSPSPTGS